MTNINILVVEDDPENWGEPIQAMYREILDESGQEGSVQLQKKGRDAHEYLQTLDPGCLHLLSLDINLGLTHPIRDNGLPNTGQIGACGLDLLKLAASRNACRAVIIITGCAHDETLSLVTRNDGELRIIQMSLEEHVRSFFPGRYKLLRKVPRQQREIKVQIEYFKTLISAKDLLFLCRPNNEFLMERGGVWRLTFLKKTVHLQGKSCLAGLKLIQHLLKYPYQEFTAPVLRRFGTPGEQCQTTRGREEKAKAFDAGLVLDRTGFERLPDERGPSKKEKNGFLNRELQLMREWLAEYRALHDVGQAEKSDEAWSNSERSYNQAKALAEHLQIRSAIIELAQVNQQYSFAENWKTLLESLPPSTKDEDEPSGEKDGAEEKKNRSQKTPPQEAQDASRNSIKKVLKMINECHPELHDHLRWGHGIQIGAHRCVYSPRTEVEWFLENE